MTAVGWQEPLRHGSWRACAAALAVLGCSSNVNVAPAGTGGAPTDVDGGAAPSPAATAGSGGFGATGGSGGAAEVEPCAGFVGSVSVLGDGPDQLYEAVASGRVVWGKGSGRHLEIRGCAEETCIRSDGGAELALVTSADAVGPTFAGGVVDYRAPSGVTYQGDAAQVKLAAFGAVGEPIDGSFEAVVSPPSAAAIAISGSFLVCRGHDFLAP
jgi:hypothetical protein